MPQKTQSLFRDVTIANGEALTGATILQNSKDNTDGHIPVGFYLCGINMPAAWTAASLAFKVSTDGGTTFNDLYDSAGNEYFVTADASQYIILDPSDFAAITHFKIESATASTGAAVNQGAARTLTLVVRAV